MCVCVFTFVTKHPLGVVYQTNSVTYDVHLGSYKCRAGWANDESPSLIFKNIVARPKAKKTSVYFLCFYFLIIVHFIPFVAYIPASWFINVILNHIVQVCLRPKASKH